MKTIETEFGSLEINEQDIIHFEDGVFGFEAVKDYILINHDEQGVIMTMQPVDVQVPQFVVLDPYAVIPDFSPVLAAHDLTRFGHLNMDQLKFLIIAVVSENYQDTVVNLKSPIVIDPKTQSARQVFLENSDYSMKYRVFDHKEEPSCS